MLNIGKMGPHSRRYYCDQVARSATDYYLGNGESPGRWTGAGVRGLGLSGSVTAEQLDAVLAGEHPFVGGALNNHPARTVPGFDLAFRAPKSVSLLWAFADDETAAVVVDAHERAVEAAVVHLESLARTRRGAGGTERVGVDGFVAAAFRHRTSRADDPLLHTHVLVANLVRTTDDGKWRTLDATPIYRSAKAAGMLYQAELRHQLTSRLGVAWSPVVNGCADLEGVDRDFIEAFSQRRQQILATMHQRGETSAKAAQVATLDTRQSKGAQADETTLRARWRERARSHGVPPDWWRSLLDRAIPTRPDRTMLHYELVGPEGLTKDRNAFTRRDVIQAVAERLSTGAPAAEVVAFADRFLEIGHDRRELAKLTSGDPDDPWMSTTELVNVERTAVDRARTTIAAGATLPAAEVERFLFGRTSLAPEQADMVRRLVGDPGAVQVVLGKAGTGKTYALDAVRELYESQGIRVSGAALAARAALELEQAAGIASTTIAGLLHRLDDPARCPLQPGQVLVIDEAGMVGTRQLARLLDHAASLRVKTIVVGDPHQLPAIEAGGLFVALTEQLDPVRLANNRRQVEPWEVKALDELREGDVAVGLAAYEHHGRVVTGSTAQDVREKLVEDWWGLVRDDPGRPDVLMVALRRADVDDLNRQARARMAAVGRLHGSRIAAAGRTFQQGDRVICLRNRSAVGVTNGDRGTVVAIQPGAGLGVLLDRGVTVHLSHNYLDAGHLTHGYAITGHKAQGMTVDHTLVLGSDALYREWGYVALSRGRRSNRLYVHERADLVDGGPHTREHSDMLERVRRGFASRRQEASLTQRTAGPAQREQPSVQSAGIRR